MEITIDVDESIPDFVRAWVGDAVADLVDQVKAGVRSGELRPGEALPSTRQLANDLRLDEVVVAKAYRILESDGFIHQGYLVTYVRPELG